MADIPHRRLEWQAPKDHGLREIHPRYDARSLAVLDEERVAIVFAHGVARFLNRGPAGDKSRLGAARVPDPGTQHRVEALRVALPGKGVKATRKFRIEECRKALIFLNELKNGGFGEEIAKGFLCGDKACAGGAMDDGLGIEGVFRAEDRRDFLTVTLRNR